MNISGSSFHDNTSYNFYAAACHDPETTVLWATDCWWDSTDETAIAASIYDNQDSATHPHVRYKSFGASCEVALGRDADGDVH